MQKSPRTRKVNVNVYYYYYLVHSFPEPFSEIAQGSSVTRNLQ